MIENTSRDMLRVDNYLKTDDLKQDKRIYQFFQKEGKLKIETGHTVFGV
jgi:hypothetical protein